MKKIITLLAFALISGNASAGFWNGNELHQYCESDMGKVGTSFCQAYVSAVIDTQEALMTKRSCHTADNLNTVGQARDIVRNWSKANPQFRSMSAADVVSVSLFEAYMPKVRWMQNGVWEDGEEKRAVEFSQSRTDGAGKWVAHCSGNIYIDADDLWFWMITLPDGLQDRHEAFMKGLLYGTD